ANEPRPKLGVGRRGQGQNLERVVTRQTWMLGEVDLAHSTNAEQPLDHISGENLTAVQRHVGKPTNWDKADANSANTQLTEKNRGLASAPSPALTGFCQR